MRNFTEWLAGFRSAIAGYKYYTDFDKIYRNVDKIKDASLYEALEKKSIEYYKHFR